MSKRKFSATAARPPVPLFSETAHRPPVPLFSATQSAQTIKITLRRTPPRISEYQAARLVLARQPTRILNEEPMYFSSYADSRMLTAIIQWNSPSPDPTIPTTDNEVRLYVRQLTSSFSDISSANDSENSQYLKRLAPGAEYYPPWAIEACSWHIVNEAIKIHTDGFQSDKIFDREILKAMETSKNMFFDERMSWVCKAIESSKYIAVSLLKDEKLMTAIAAPMKLYASSQSNTVSNKKRNDRLLKGKAVEKEEENAAVAVAAEEKAAEKKVEDAALAVVVKGAEDAALAMMVLASSDNLAVVNHHHQVSDLQHPDFSSGLPS